MSEWRCPECDDMEGTYQDLRATRDSGVDTCPQCGTEVVTIEGDEKESEDLINEMETIFLRDPPWRGDEKCVARIAEIQKRLADIFQNRSNEMQYPSH